jgi:HSP20 family molecular chaperone IbpA
MQITKYDNKTPYKYGFPTLWDIFEPEFFDSPSKSSSLIPKYRYTKSGIELDVPGVSKSDISIEVEGNVLHVNAKRKFEDVEETYEKEYSASFSLNDAVDKEDISASFDNGVLKLKLKEREDIKKQIEVT